MKMNRVIALMTAMLLTFSLTACAESSAAPELDGKTEYELLEVENEILLANNALWEKVFLSMSKNVTDDVLSSNYGDVLMSAVEGAKEQFSEEAHIYIIFIFLNDFTHNIQFKIIFLKIFLKFF